VSLAVQHPLPTSVGARWATFTEKSLRKIPAVSFAVLFSVLASSTLAAQTSIYMTVDAIPGDQTVAPHMGEFKINSASVGMLNTISLSLSGSATGYAAGKATYEPVKIQMQLNPLASSKFALDLTAGTKIASVEVRFYNSTRLYYKTVFENAYLTSISTDASDAPVQNLEFTYSRARWFAPTDAAGLTAPVQVACWDLATNTKC
jgi:type VI protein secretion system component Hcp